MKPSLDDKPLAKPPGPPLPPTESPRQIAAQALLFLGPVVACVGMLAIIKTGKREIGFAMMAPIGLVMSLVGWVMRHGGKKSD